MGYVVETGASSVGSAVDRIPAARRADVSSTGHLIVGDGSSSPLAVYAPGQWNRAFKDNAVTSSWHQDQEKPYTSGTGDPV